MSAATFGLPRAMSLSCMRINGSRYSLWLVHPVRRTFTTQGLRNGRWKSAWRSVTTKATVVEGTTTTVKQTGWTADKIGKSFLAGGSLFGIGSLCYYGLGLSNETGAIDRAAYWPKHVRDRVRSTYTYFTSGIGVTAVAAYAAARTQFVTRFLVTRPILSLVTFAVGSIGSAMMCYAIPYTPETLPAKMAAYGVFTTIMGITLAPVVLMGGPLVARAAMYTAGVVGGLSLTAACAPSEKYLNMSGPLTLGLGVVFVASLGSIFVAPGTVVFSGLHAVYMYGGLVLFGGFLLYDTQRIIRAAERGHHYDPVNHSISIYLDTINIFIRILYLLSGSGGNRRR